MKEKVFLNAFKEEFWYQARMKFGRSKEMSRFEMYTRPSMIILYILALCFLSYHHYEIPHILLVLAAYIWTSNIAMGSIRGIYHRRLELSESPKGVREVYDFKFSEKLFTYFIAASVLTGIFAGCMSLINYVVTGLLSIKYALLAILSVILVLFYNLVKEH